MSNTAKLTIVLSQMTQAVGDLAANAAAMRAVRARHRDADLILYPELQLIGYPPEDLVLKPALAECAATMLDALAADTADGGPAMLVGSVERDGANLYNIVALLDGGRIVATRRKHELPNYGTFDEKRVFAAGPLPDVVEWRGVKLGLPICEDGWLPAVSAHLAAQGAELLISVNGSPYEIDKDERRLSKVFAARVAETKLPLIFLNRVGGQDELVFDGCSFVLNRDGQAAHRLTDWDEEERVTHWTVDAGGWRCAAGAIAAWEDHPADIYSAMILSLRDYVERNGFPGVVLGLSGGIDSAICAAIAVDALGEERVRAIMLPYRYTSKESLADAAACAKALGCHYDTVPIGEPVDGFLSALSDMFEGTESGITEENLQSRARGTILMAISNKFGSMVVTTGNKSEMSVGYATLYGDMNGGFNPIKDLYKMQVYALAAWRNAHVPPGALGPSGEVIPANILSKAPSAELRPNQTDQDSLPPYPVLDDILECLVEKEMGVDEIVAR
ncbi:MAG TPA: NAD+ synthase, partial [Sphingopyxis sp.]|nr:NAD+ synthase [Sphingopyxis sp.]